MFYPYCTIGEFTEVCNSPLNDDGESLVHIETPDEKLGFRTFECLLPSYSVVKNIGFSKSEVESFMAFCRSNAALLLESARKGGIANAYDL